VIGRILAFSFFLMVGVADPLFAANPSPSSCIGTISNAVCIGSVDGGKSINIDIDGTLTVGNSLTIEKGGTISGNKGKIVFNKGSALTLMEGSTLSVDRAIFNGSGGSSTPNNMITYNPGASIKIGNITIENVGIGSNFTISGNLPYIDINELELRTSSFKLGDMLAVFNINSLKEIKLNDSSLDLDKSLNVGKIFLSRNSAMDMNGGKLTVTSGLSGDGKFSFNNGGSQIVCNNNTSSTCNFTNIEFSGDSNGGSIIYKLFEHNTTDAITGDNVNIFDKADNTTTITLSKGATFELHSNTKQSLYVNNFNISGTSNNKSTLVLKGGKLNVKGNLTQQAITITTDSVIRFEDNRSQIICGTNCIFTNLEFSKNQIYTLFGNGNNAIIGNDSNSNIDIFNGINNNTIITLSDSATLKLDGAENPKDQKTLYVKDFKINDGGANNQTILNLNGGNLKVSDTLIQGTRAPSNPSNPPDLSNIPNTLIKFTNEKSQIQCNGTDCNFTNIEFSGERVGKEYNLFDNDVGVTNAITDNLNNNAVNIFKTGNNVATITLSNSATLKLNGATGSKTLYVGNFNINNGGVPEKITTLHLNGGSLVIEHSNGTLIQTNNTLVKFTNSDSQIQCNGTGCNFTNIEFSGEGSAKEYKLFDSSNNAITDNLNNNAVNIFKTGNNVAAITLSNSATLKLGATGSKTLYVKNFNIKDGDINNQTILNLNGGKLTISETLTQGDATKTLVKFTGSGSQIQCNDKGCKFTNLEFSETQQTYKLFSNAGNAIAGNTNIFTKEDDVKANITLNKEATLELHKDQHNHTLYVNNFNVGDTDTNGDKQATLALKGGKLNVSNTLTQQATANAGVVNIIRFEDKNSQIICGQECTFTNLEFSGKQTYTLLGNGNNDAIIRNDPSSGTINIFDGTNNTTITLNKEATLELHKDQHNHTLYVNNFNVGGTGTTSNDKMATLVLKGGKLNVSSTFTQSDNSVIQFESTDSQIDCRRGTGCDFKNIEFKKDSNSTDYSIAGAAITDNITGSADLSRAKITLKNVSLNISGESSSGSTRSYNLSNFILEGESKLILNNDNVKLIVDKDSILENTQTISLKENSELSINSTLTIKAGASLSQENNTSKIVFNETSAKLKCDGKCDLRNIIFASAGTTKNKYHIFGNGSNIEGSFVNNGMNIKVKDAELYINDSSARADIETVKIEDLELSSSDFHLNGTNVEMKKFAGDNNSKVVFENDKMHLNIQQSVDNLNLSFNNGKYLINDTKTSAVQMGTDSEWNKIKNIDLKNSTLIVGKDFGNGGKINLDNSMLDIGYNKIKGDVVSHAYGKIKISVSDDGKNLTNGSFEGKIEKDTHIYIIPTLATDVSKRVTIATNSSNLIFHTNNLLYKLCSSYDSSTKKCTSANSGEFVIVKTDTQDYLNTINAGDENGGLKKENNEKIMNNFINKKLDITGKALEVYNNLQEQLTQGTLEDSKKAMNAVAPDIAYSSDKVINSNFRSISNIISSRLNQRTNNHILIKTKVYDRAGYNSQYENYIQDLNKENDNSSDTSDSKDNRNYSQGLNENTPPQFLLNNLKQQLLYTSNIWGELLYNTMEQGGDKDNKVKSTSGGFVIGVDTMTKYSKLGVSYGYIDTDIKGFERDTKMGSHILSVYNELNLSGLYLSSIGSITYSSSKENDIISKNAKYNTAALSVQSILGIDNDFLIPEVGISMVNSGWFFDYDDNLDQKVKQKKTYNVMSGIANIKYKNVVDRENDVQFKTEIKVGVVYDIFNTNPEYEVTFGSSTYPIKTIPESNKMSINYGIGLTLDFLKTSSISFNYGGEVRKNYKSDSVSLKFNLMF
jgi:hypothetical protein